MAQGLNKAMLIGNLGQDPELKYTQGGQAVLKLRVATTESVPTASGERQDRTEWHSVVVWGKRAEALGKILSKGKQLYIEGRIQTRSWDDKDGNKKYATEINANEIVLLGGGGARAGGEEGSFGGGGRSGGGGYGGRGGGGGGGGGGRAPARPADDFADGLPQDEFGGGGGGGGNDDDIPF